MLKHRQSPRSPHNPLVIKHFGVQNGLREHFERQLVARRPEISARQSHHVSFSQRYCISLEPLVPTPVPVVLRHNDQEHTMPDQFGVGNNKEVARDFHRNSLRGFQRQTRLMHSHSAGYARGPLAIENFGVHRRLGEYLVLHNYRSPVARSHEVLSCQVHDVSFAARCLDAFKPLVPTPMYVILRNDEKEDAPANSIGVLKDGNVAPNQHRNIVLSVKRRNSRRLAWICASRLLIFSCDSLESMAISSAASSMRRRSMKTWRSTAKLACIGIESDMSMSVLACRLLDIDIYLYQISGLSFLPWRHNTAATEKLHVSADAPLPILAPDKPRTIEVDVVDLLAAVRPAVLSGESQDQSGTHLDKLQSFCIIRCMAQGVIGLDPVALAGSSSHKRSDFRAANEDIVVHRSSLRAFPEVRHV